MVSESPELSIDNVDRGDDTYRRFRYQSTYTAIMCCAILDDTLDIAEIFCEHHEDILLKHSDGTFSGLQIKTRDMEQDSWKSNDEDAINSFARFAKLDSEFPGFFRRFGFLTNHQIHTAGNGQDIFFVLKCILEANSLEELNSVLMKFIKRVSERAHCSEENTFNALKKAYANHDLPKLNDCMARLRDETARIDGSRSYTSVAHAAEALAEECCKASSLAHEDAMPSYISAIDNQEDIKLIACVKGKRINEERLLGIIKNGMDETVPLYCDPSDLIEPGKGDTELLCKKLDAGGFSAISINAAKDLRDRADYLGIMLTKKYGDKNGLQQYDELRGFVLNDAATAYENTKQKDNLFGKIMLDELRRNLKSRISSNTKLKKYCIEHLEGIAFSLTSECKIYWSIDRPWEVQQ